MMSQFQVDSAVRAVKAFSRSLLTPATRLSHARGKRAERTRITASRFRRLLAQRRARGCRAGAIGGGAAAAEAGGGAGVPSSTGRWQVTSVVNSAGMTAVWSGNSAGGACPSAARGARLPDQWARWWFDDIRCRRSALGSPVECLRSCPPGFAHGRRFLRFLRCFDDAADFCNRCGRLGAGSDQWSGRVTNGNARLRGDVRLRLLTAAQGIQCRNRRQGDARQAEHPNASSIVGWVVVRVVPVVPVVGLFELFESANRSPRRFESLRGLGCKGGKWILRRGPFAEGSDQQQWRLVFEHVERLVSRLLSRCRGSSWESGPGMRTVTCRRRIRLPPTG